MRTTWDYQTNTTKQRPSEVSLWLFFSTLLFILPPKAKKVACFSFISPSFPSKPSNCFPFLSRMYIQNVVRAAQAVALCHKKRCLLEGCIGAVFRYLGRFTRGMPSFYRANVLSNMGTKYINV